MRYALIGYGKMGRAIEEAATARGHALVVVVERSARRGEPAAPTIAAAPAATWRGVELAFEFTRPDAAKENVISLLKRGVSVVCGTTGWDGSDPAVRRAAAAAKRGVVIAPNFSIGMSLFYAAVERAAQSFHAVGDYDPWIVEWHHSKKADAPSGTARRLARLLASASGREAPVAAIRAGHEPGRHRVGFDGPDDAVTLEHAARGRGGFAKGAVLAAEWIRDRSGVHGFEDVVAGLLKNAKARGGRR